LDRDGVLNPLVYNCVTHAYESPHKPADFSLYTYTEKSLRILKEAGYYNLVVSNQPSFAKGKTSLENIREIEELLSVFSKEHGGLITKAYYCYHHPMGVVPQYTCICRCRKPGTLFLEQAAEEFGLDPCACWFVGDRDSDVACGRSFGCKTIKINNPHSMYDTGTAKENRASAVTDTGGDGLADYYVENLLQAVEVIAGA